MAIVGTSGPDTLQQGTFGAGSQLIQGLGGDDTLMSTAGETLEGGAGNDLLESTSGIGRASYASATGPVHVELGVSGPQAVGADQGVDTLEGMGGVIGSAYNDTLSAASSSGQPGQGAWIGGGAGSDLIIGGAAGGSFSGDDGDDTIDASHSVSNVWINAGAGDDVLIFNSAHGSSSLSFAGAGNDLVYNANDIYGGDGNDTITGSYSSGSSFGASLYGDSGDDSLIGTDRPDALWGGSGHNTIIGAGGGDTIYVFRGGDPTDMDYRDDVVRETGGYLLNLGGVYGTTTTLDLGAGTGHIDIVSGGTVLRLADITFTGVPTIQDSNGSDSILGSTGNDTISAGNGQNTLFGADGDDRIEGGSGHNQINGNKGADTISGRSSVGDWLLGGQGNDLIGAQSNGSDIINGNMGDDTIHGSSNGSETLRGGQGDDVITGGSVGDWITGDLGRNTLNGGGGADTFHAGAGQDVVTDFNSTDGDRVEVAHGFSYHASQSGADVQVAFSGGGSLLLQNTQLSGLSSGWIVAT